jgi:hypothetical protein
MLTAKILPKKTIQPAHPTLSLKKAPPIKKAPKKSSLLISALLIKTSPSQPFLTNVTKQPHLILRQRIIRKL